MTTREQKSRAGKMRRQKKSTCFPKLFWVSAPQGTEKP